MDVCAWWFEYRKLNFDAIVDVALGPLARTNCQVNLDDVICVSKLQCPVLPSDSVHLIPATK